MSVPEASTVLVASSSSSTLALGLSRLLGLLLLSQFALCEQTEFEAASVKQGVPFPGRPGFYIMKGGGLGTPTPGEFTAVGAPLLNLVLRAYSRNAFQVALRPGLETDRYDIVARVPAGATVAQVSLMLRNLLVARIGLVVHFETRKDPIYEMVVAKGGLKMKSAQSPSAAGLSAATGEDMMPGISIGKDETYELAPGYPNRVVYSTGGSAIRATARIQDMQDIVRMLEREVGRTVRDKTGLRGKYDFDFSFNRADPTTSSGEVGEIAFGQDLFSAIQSHLGLKLLPKTGSREELVVDSWKKMPVEQ